MKYLALAAATAAPAVAQRDNPIVTVIALLKDLAAQGSTDMKAEDTMWGEYDSYCKTTLSDKKYDIKDGEKSEDQFEATIDECKASVLAATGVVAKSSGLVAEYQGDIAAATAVRQAENVHYVKEHQDYTDSIYACEDAVKSLGIKQNVAAGAPTEVLAQMKSKLRYSKNVDRLDHLIALVAAPAAPTYAVEARSGTVVKMLKDLKAEFVEELTELDKKETNAAHAFSQLEMALTKEIENNEDLIANKKAEIGKKTTEQGEAEKNLADTRATLKADNKYHKELTAQHELKEKQYDTRHDARTKELTAISEALAMLEADTVSTAGAGQRYGASFLQVRSGSLKMSPNQMKALDFLRGQASKLNSDVLAQVAASAAADPFGKVRAMVKDLLTRLQEQAEADLDKKTYCDKEMSDNTKARNKLTTAKEGLEADQDSLNAKIDQLSENIGTLSTEIADLDKAVEEATTLRNAETKKNTQTVEESTAAQKAVEAALAKLNEMYSEIGAAKAVTLVQATAKQPAVFGDETYKGMTGSSTGVIGLLELIASDFATLITETTTDEDSAASMYEKFMKTSEITRATKVGDRTNKTSLKDDAENQLGNVVDDLKFTNGELDTKNQQWQDLQPVCVYTGVSHAQRAEKMQSEIKSLQEALEILGGLSDE